MAPHVAEMLRARNGTRFGRCDYDPKSGRPQHASADNVHTQHLKQMQKVFKGVFNLEPGETHFREDPHRYPALWAGCSKAGLASHQGLM